MYRSVVKLKISWKEIIFCVVNKNMKKGFY